ncbi:MAG TPA: lipocalin family protein [Pyrinomonadaceae bacterium]|nr:lipocalin family protein [Pyrinomonadaceae bacterium]
MSFLILILLVATVSCGRVSQSVSPEKSIVGSWKLMGMVKTPFPIEEVTESDLMTGQITFKPDKTFDGEVVYPKSPDKNTKVFGTYTVEGDILTVSNQANNSTTKSTLKFEKDFMVGTPLNPEGFIAYWKRIN